MCGIVAALPSYRESLLVRPQASEVLAAIPGVCPNVGGHDPSVLHAELRDLGAALDSCLRLLARAGTAATLLAEPTTLAIADDTAERLLDQLTALDESIDEGSVGWDADSTEAVQTTLRQARDAAYGVRHDRLAPIRWISGLSLHEAPVGAGTMVGYLAVDRVLTAIDRLEVRGRDSAGVSIWVQLDPSDLNAAGSATFERQDPLLKSGSVRRFPSGLAFVYKRAAVVGKLGDNVAQLRASIRQDKQLHFALARPSARVSVLAHTRWASIGRISEANAHPVDNWLATAPPTDLALAVINGDIDNHLALRRQYGYGEDQTISTDAKLVPLRLAEYAKSNSPSAAMAAAVREFDGSMAIAAQLSAAPDSLVLAVKGSGQGLYVGLSENGYMVASEVYGLVASAQDYLRLDGGVRMHAGQAAGTILMIDRDAGGSLAGIMRYDGDGSPVPVTVTEVRSAELTTRDLALGHATHYLEKEIGEAASSFRKTLRGRIRTSQGHLSVDLPTSSVPADLAALVAAGQIRRIALVGQGTAAVACQGIAQVMHSLLGSRLLIRAAPASEFSAYELESNLTDTLMVAISQSGSTTDTNRTVDLARVRGARVVAIINRRDSDLASKSHGVLYTSDGRDVEMAVASTKAFYAQVAAGCLLGLQLGRILGVVAPDREDALLQALHDMPEKLEKLHAGQDAIAAVARATAVRYQNWAVVGSGPNRVAAAEARIKLSELCYRTVSTDAIEDKKHIDLSAEALVLVCAAGTPPGQVRDIQKEVEIFSAHRNVPIVITDTHDSEEWRTPHVIRVPAAHPILAWILSTAAAHLFSYHAAASIDACADDLRAALDALEIGVDEETAWRPAVQELLTRTLDRVSAGELVGVLSARTLMLLTVAVADIPAPPLGSPVSFAEHLQNPDEFLRSALTCAVDEMTRSIDSVKHQAKTVTVGTSRDNADMYENDIVRALQEAGMDATSALSHAVLVAIHEHAALLTRVRGVTRYRLRGEGTREVIVIRKTGAAAALTSRVEQWAPLVGSKELVARTRQARLLRGAHDGRLVLVVPEQEGALLSGLAVIHLELVKSASGAHLISALSTTRGRADELRAAITEAGIDFRPGLLADLPVEDVLLAPVESIAAAVRRAGLHDAADRD